MTNTEKSTIDNKTVVKKEATVLRCKECGYRIRGKNHKEGDHHKSGMKKKMEQIAN